MTKIVSSKELKEILDKEPQVPRTPFGIYGVDALTEGYADGELITITGYSGHGKTSFCRSITYTMSDKHKRILWLSFEETQKEFLNKFPDLPNFYMPEQNKINDMKWIEDMILKAKEELLINVVFVDHLDYIVEMLSQPGVNKSDMIGDVLRRLRQQAIKHNITIFLIAHTKQPVDDQLPTMASLKGSSFIVQESSAVYAINRIKMRGQRSGEYGEDSLFLVLKQRHTGTMGKRTRLTYKKNKFQDLIPDQRLSDMVG